MQILTDIIAALPPLQGERDVIVEGQQSVKDIMKEVLNAHQVFASDYDTIVDFFAMDADPLRSLFQFCKNNMRYVAESEKDQTTRSPIAILMLSDNWGVDCKHYSGWIAGVIDAMNRAGYSNYDWTYRFVSYNPFDADKEHVFVVVNPGADEIWIDPAPVINGDGSYTQRSFNDRKVIPFYVTDKTPYMSLNRISGCNCISNPRYQSMGYIGYTYSYYDGHSMFQPAGTDYLSTDLWAPTLTDSPITTPIDYIDPVDTQYQAPLTTDSTASVFPTIQDSGGSYILPTFDKSLELIDFSTPYDPGLPIVDTAIQTDLNRIESTTFPVITDYPTVTNAPIVTLPTTDTTTATTTASTPPSSGLTAGFDLMTFIKTNPVETILIGSAVVIGGIYLFKRKKKKQRA